MKENEREKLIKMEKRKRYLDPARLGFAIVVATRLILGLLRIASHNFENGWELINHLEQPLPEKESVHRVSLEASDKLNCFRKINSKEEFHEIKTDLVPLFNPPKELHIQRL